MSTNTGQYNKGTSGNRQGRPAEPKEALAKLKKFIDKKSSTSYKQLAKAIEANEPWAMELVFRELMPKPDSLCLEIDLDNPDKIGAMVEGILSSLSTCKHLTVSESCQVLSALAYLRKTEVKEYLPKFQ